MRQQIHKKAKIPDVPAEIQELAARRELGELQKIHKVPRYDTGIAGAGMCSLAIAGIMGLMLLGKLPPTPGFVATGLILVIIGCFLLFTPGIYPRWYIYRYQSGFIYEKGRNIQVFRWNEIISITSDKHFLWYKVLRQDGYKITLSNFTELNTLMDSIFEELARQFAPPELIIAPQRHTRTFPTTSISRDGVGSIPWHNIQEFVAKNGRVTVVVKGE